MGFFELDPSLEAAILDPEKVIKVRLELEDETGAFAPIGEDAILEAVFTSGFDTSGGIVSHGHVIIDTSLQALPPFKETEGKIKVLFTAGETGRYLHRFTMYTSPKGFMRITEGGRTDKVEVFLEDFPGRLKRTGGFKNWSEAEVLTDIKFADKEDTENSLLYRIAAKGDVAPDEIDSCTVLLTLPYIRLTKDPWEELCELAKASFALLEGGTDKKIIFSASPYLTGAIEPDEAEALDLELFCKVEIEDAMDVFNNDVRLRWNKPERLEHQKLWQYDDPPIFYDVDLKKSFPFKFLGEKREIESADLPYYAPYTARLPDGTEHRVVSADMLDPALDIELAMEADADGLTVEALDTTSYPEKAIIKLACSEDTELYELTIYGRPIVVKANYSCYRRDTESIDNYGLYVLNATGKYFSDAEIFGLPHYQEWTERTLLIRKQRRRRIRLQSEYGLFHARVGAKTTMTGIENSGISCSVEHLKFRYRKHKGFTATLRMLEEIPE